MIVLAQCSPWYLLLATQLCDTRDSVGYSARPAVSPSRQLVVR